jgi:flavin reductase (DIM6/NTAB) family NADH-FMN oxidoreductase RutF
MKKILKKILFGITLPQEYLCVKQNEFPKPLKVFACDKLSKISFDITSHNLFIGYKPLVIAVDKKYLNELKFSSLDHIHLSFRSEENEELASLEVKFIYEVKLTSVTCLLFEGVKGSHSFTSNFHKLCNSIYYSLTADKKKNVFLPGNLYEQVKIAYSIPREIYLASIGSNNLYNIFPTDLSGQLDDDIFIMSLRSRGKANEQIEKVGRCLVAKMEAGSFMEVYSAGKNHMRELSDTNKLGIRLREEISAALKFPIPLGAIQYFELEKMNKFETGIHTIHFFRIINSVSLSNSQEVLMHIHRDYTEWRIKNGINTNYLLRK